MVWNRHQPVNVSPASIYSRVLKANLIVDETPLLKEGMNSHDCADISCQVPSACGHRQVLHWVQTVCVDHEVSVILVYGWCLASISVVEELWESLSFNGVDLVHIEPSTVTW
jgi:hypothetical protein